MDSAVKKFRIGGGVSFFVALAGTGVQYRWPEQKWIGTGLIILGCLGLLVVLVAWFVRAQTIKEYERLHPHVVGGNAITPAQQLTQTANPHNEFKPHIEFKPVISQEQAIAKDHRVFPKTLPELECVGFEIVDGYLDSNGRLVDDIEDAELTNEDRFHGSCRVAQVDFHLKPLVDSDPWVELRTQLVYYRETASAVESKRVRDGVWREHGDVVQMPINSGDTRTLVLALEFNDAGFTTYEYRERTRDYGLRTSYLAPIKTPLPDDIINVHVRLFGKYLGALRLDQEISFELTRAERSRPTIKPAGPLRNLYTP